MERFTPIGRDAIRYDVTIDDPKTFTRSWQIAMPLYRRLEPNMQLIEYRCTEFAEEFLYGHLRKEPLVTHWEGETMIIDITPPRSHPVTSSMTGTESRRTQTTASIHDLRTHPRVRVLLL